MKTREIVEGALMSAVVATFMFFNIQMGGIFSYVMFLLPLPLVYVSFKYGYKTGLIVYVGSLVLTAMLGDIISIITLFIEGIIGVYYGNGLRKNIRSSILLLNTILLAILYNIITIVLASEFFGYNIDAEIEIIGELFNGFAIDFAKYFRLMFYVTIPLIGIMEGYLTHVFSRFLLRRLKFAVEKPISVYDYEPHKWAAYLALLLTAVFYISLSTNFLVGIYQEIGIVVGIIGALFLYFYGIVALMYLFKLLIPKASVLSMFIILFASLYLLIGILIIGFLYITTDMKQKVVERIMNAS